MSSVQLNCRNFKCRFNNKGECAQERITLIPQGYIVKQIRCTDAASRGPGDKPAVVPFEDVPPVATGHVRPVQPATDEKGGSE